jgi:aspartyl-tRNA synthetase
MESSKTDEKKIEEQQAVSQDGTSSKGEDKKDSKAEREKKKAERLAARQQKGQADQQEWKKDPNDPCASKFGDCDLNRSQSNPDERYGKKFTEVHELNETHAGQEVLIRGRLHSSRAAGKKLVFIVIRERFATVQAILAVNEPEVSPGMAEYTRRIPKESIIEVKAKVVLPEKPIEGCSQKVELSITEIWTINKSAPILPFQLEDAARRCENQEDEEKA